MTKEHATPRHLKRELDKDEVNWIRRRLDLFFKKVQRDKDGKYEKHFSRVFSHVKRSFTIRHVMMMVSEFPDDVGLGVDLTEDALNWIEYEGRVLPEGRTLEDQEIPMHAVLEMCHHVEEEKANTDEEAERLRRLRDNAPEKAAKYTGHLFKDKGTAVRGSAPCLLVSCPSLA